ncbi:MAG: NifB/NifX family molybdenum-iron cluster-binding protein [Kiritimatiellae bacterium]|jgi:predicted Fe-Mo cluster-binding NifX family protein|nr:NifB/NifX family molybdenum-iron cluster-binding protein [Kiritimatiellia bacterium]MDD4342465.1 NifB/NifX family molybdenum-iron cluster-binding protein [Kiritimatiellia bacterium]MDY0149563.1 NifB/NifX family molybdenum-iron cluster-binding protein [Kiritimatiellia bacterium]
MKIAIPVVDEKLCLHFGHCAQFAMVDVDDQEKTITSTEFMVPPAHEPGALPKWLNEQGVNVILAGGMGSRAQQLFEQNGIQVVVGCAPATPETLVETYLAGELEPGDNVCDH